MSVRNWVLKCLCITAYLMTYCNMCINVMLKNYFKWQLTSWHNTIVDKEGELKPYVP